MTECSKCGLKFSESKAAQLEDCPGCGSLFKAKPQSDNLNPIKKYFRNLTQITFQPGPYFKKMKLTGGVSQPLAFALITHWIGTTVNAIWKPLLGGSIVDYVQRLMTWIDQAADIDNPGRGKEVLHLIEYRERFFHWAWGAGSVVADPFINLITILFTTSLVFLGARILVTPGKKGAPSEITFESALRIICYGMAPAILLVIPFVGTPLAALGAALVTIIAAKEVYHIGWGRAVVVALFPKVIFVALAFTGIALLVVTLFSFISFLKF